MRLHGAACMAPPARATERRITRDPRECRPPRPRDPREYRPFLYEIGAARVDGRSVRAPLAAGGGHVHEMPADTGGRR